MNEQKLSINQVHVILIFFLITILLAAMSWSIITLDADVSLVGTHAAKKAADMVLQGQFGMYRAHSQQAKKYIRGIR